MIDYKVIGNRIKKYRKSAKLTQENLAEKLDVTNKYISQIECGVAEISLKRIFEVAEILKIKPESLISDINPDESGYLFSEIYDRIKNLPNKKKELAVQMLDLISQYK
jgi:transcriptional regulator with XRE-family HTH domain